MHILFSIYFLFLLNSTHSWTPRTRWPQCRREWCPQCTIRGWPKWQRSSWCTTKWGRTRVPPGPSWCWRCGIGSWCARRGSFPTYMSAWWGRWCPAALRWWRTGATGPRCVLLGRLWGWESRLLEWPGANSAAVLCLSPLGRWAVWDLRCCRNWGRPIMKTRGRWLLMLTYGLW